MSEVKTIGISSMITLGLVSLALLMPTFFETPKYYCESESSIMECVGGLSGGSATRCYLNTEKTSWDYCSTGWVEITDDRPIQDNGSIPNPNLGDKIWLCYVEGCIAI